VDWTDIWPRIDSIFGWLTEDEAKKLYELAQRTVPGDYIIELGAFMGRSSAALAYGLTTDSVPAAGRLVVSIDTWAGTKDSSDTELHSAIMREHGVTDLLDLHFDNMAARNLAHVTRRLRGTTVPYGIEWAGEWAVTAGLVFIDADHRYESVKQDFDAWSPLVRSGGYVALHDAFAPGPARVIAEMPDDFVRIEGARDLVVFQRVRPRQ